MSWRFLCHKLWAVICLLPVANCLTPTMSFSFKVLPPGIAMPEKIMKAVKNKSEVWPAPKRGKARTFMKSMKSITPMKKLKPVPYVRHAGVQTKFRKERVHFGVWIVRHSCKTLFPEHRLLIRIIFFLRFGIGFFKIQKNNISYWFFIDVLLIFLDFFWFEILVFLVKKYWSYFGFYIDFSVCRFWFKSADFGQYRFWTFLLFLEKNL